VLIRLFFRYRIVLLAKELVTVAGSAHIADATKLVGFVASGGVNRALCGGGD